MQLIQDPRDIKAAECRIWAHWLYWGICPGGALISCFRTGNWKPFQVALIIVVGAMILGASTTKSEDDRRVIFNGGRFIAAMVAGMMTQQNIQEARKRTGISPN
jgi:hypothetical protein